MPSCGSARRRPAGPDLERARESRGAVDLLVIRGNADEVSAKIKALNPLIYDHLPLTLEEIFIYENKEGTQ